MGQYQKAHAAELCSSCNSGQYSAASAPACTSCPMGQYQASAASSSCNSCPAGTFLGSTGSIASGSCTACTAGSYCGTTGLAAVTGACAAGTFSVASSTACSSSPQPTVSPTGTLVVDIPSPSPQPTVSPSITGHQPTVSPTCSNVVTFTRSNIDYGEWNAIAYGADVFVAIGSYSSGAGIATSTKVSFMTFVTSRPCHNTHSRHFQNGIYDRMENLGRDVSQSPIIGRLSLSGENFSSRFQKI